MNRIIICKDLCIGCKICFKSCFIDVIKWDEEKNMPVANCPKRALKMEPDYESYMFPRENIFTM